MSDKKESLHGLACPNCGGMVPIPEGQLIVRCPYCDLRSLVRGERGLQRYQVPQRVDRERARASLLSFLKGHRPIASDAAKKAVLDEDFIAYVPFWVGWARVLGWIFGQKKVRHNDSTRYEPREVKVTQDMTWNSAACDVGEFGVDTIPYTNQPLEPFNPELLHSSGMVFEPTGSAGDARGAAKQDFSERARKAANLDRISQVLVNFIRERLGLVYYPLWVIRYLYRGRSFQVVVDGFSGQVLYGKAPGNTLYRAAVLVGGMGLGSLIAVDGSAIALYLLTQMEGDSALYILGAALGLFAFGVTIMWRAYRAFRYGEQFEYRRHGKKTSQGLLGTPEIFTQMKDVTEWIDQLR